MDEIGLFSMAASSSRERVDPSQNLLSQHAVNTTDTTSTKRFTAAAPAMGSFGAAFSLSSFGASPWISSLSKSGPQPSVFSTRIVFAPSFRVTSTAF